jgi:hypothetical protein
MVSASPPFSTPSGTCSARSRTRTSRSGTLSRFRRLLCPSSARLRGRP